MSHLDQVIKNPVPLNFNHYLLGRSGYLRERGNFLWRTIYFIWNKLTNKTIRDAIFVFEKVYRNYINQPTLKPVKKLETHQLPKDSPEYKKLAFVLNYLLSRKKEFKNYVDKHPKLKLQFHTALETLPAMQDVDSKSSKKILDPILRVQLATPPALDLRALSKTPLSGKEIFGNEDRHVIDCQNPFDLLSMFDQAFKEKEGALEYRLLGARLGLQEKEHLRASLSEMIVSTERGVQGIFIPGEFHPDVNPKEFYIELESYLKRMAYKLSKENVTNDQKQKILWELAKYSENCKPTWTEGAYSLLTELYDKDLSLPNRTLRYVQHVKEYIILEWCDTRLGNDNFFKKEWHGVDWMRAELGKTLGLDRSRIKFDPYKNGIGYGRFPYSKKECYRWFLEDFSAERLVSGVTEQFNIVKMQYDDPTLLTFFRKRLQLNGVASPDAFIENFFYSKQNITPAGVAFLLRQPEIGVLL